MLDILAKVLIAAYMILLRGIMAAAAWVALGVSDGTRRRDGYRVLRLILLCAGGSLAGIACNSIRWGFYERGPGVPQRVRAGMSPWGVWMNADVSRYRTSVHILATKLAGTSVATVYPSHYFKFFGLTQGNLCTPGLVTAGYRKPCAKLCTGARRTSQVDWVWRAMSTRLALPSEMAHPGPPSPHRKEETAASRWPARLRTGLSGW